MKFAELKANWKWMLEHMPDDEPVTFPRRAAKKRIANKEFRKRIIFDTDPLGYSRFHARKEAWMLELNDNPSLFAEALDAAMKDFDVRGWKDSNNAESTEIT